MNNFRLVPQVFYNLIVNTNFVFTTCLLFILGIGLKGQSANNKIISNASILVPQDFLFNQSLYSDDLVSLNGLPSSSPKVKQLTDKILNDLRSKGFTFSRITSKYVPKDKTLVFEVLVGKNGDAWVTGNNWFSNNSVLKSLSWKPGGFFNYSSFQASATKYNSNRFIEVDSKLRPRRSKSGEIIVDADFDVDDSMPVVFTANLANDGSAQSSGWRSTLGLEWWEPFPTADKISFNWLTDPESTSTLNSFTANYSGSYSDNWNWAVFSGYSESEYNNVLSTGNFDILGEGLFAGFLVSRTLSKANFGSVSANIGLTYLDLENTFAFGNSAANVSEISFLVPRIGLQGVIDYQDVIPGRTFWSLSLLSDAGSLNDPISFQTSNDSSEFYIGQLSLTTLQSIAKSRQVIDLYLNFQSQLASDALPSSLKKSIGGIDSVRGYDERVIMGDHGFHLNSEFRFGAFSMADIGNIQPFIFYDVGHVSSEPSTSGGKFATTLDSAGGGFRCSFKPSLDFSLHLATPLKDYADNKKHDPRLHFNLDFRF